MHHPAAGRWETFDIDEVLYCDRLALSGLIRDGDERVEIFEGPDTR
jgi:hypothetical protein